MRDQGRVYGQAGRCFALLAVVAAAVIAGAYHFSFPVKADCGNLAACIRDFYNRGRSIAYSPSIQIHDSITLGKTTYVLIELDEDLGHVVLVRGMTGRYKIDRLGYGGGNFRHGIVESGGRKYLLYGGRNTGRQIASITVALEGLRYRLELPQKERFLISAEIDNRIASDHLDLDPVTLWNADGKTSRENMI